MQIVNGSTDVTTYFVLRDSTAHAPKTDVTITDIDVYYLEQGAAMAAKVDLTALAAADSAHADSKGYHCGQGLYRIDWPDAAFDGGIGKKVYLAVVCTGVDTEYREVELVAANTGDTYALANGATGFVAIDTVVDAIKAKTDSLTFTVAGDLDVNVQSWAGASVAAPEVAGYPKVDLVLINGDAASGSTTIDANIVSVSGDTTAADNLELAYDGTGYAGGTIKQKVDLDTIKTQSITCAAGVTVLASVGTAATSTAQTGDAYARIGAAGVGLTGIPWNASWDAEVQSECTDALNAYDPPTNAEMEARTLLAAAYGTAANQTTIAGYLDTEIAAILGDTDELQKAWTDGGRLDLLIDAIKAKTDLMLDAAAIRTAVGLANANLDTQLGALAPASTALSTAVWTNTKAGYLDAAVSTAGGGASAADIADAVWNEDMTAHDTAGSAGAYQVSGGSGLTGAGADEVTITWTAGGQPVADGDVWVATDEAGAHVVAGTLHTDTDGRATFLLDAGSTYYLFAQKNGQNSIRGQRFVAVAD